MEDTAQDNSEQHLTFNYLLSPQNMEVQSYRLYKQKGD